MYESQNKYLPPEGKSENFIGRRIRNIRTSNNMTRAVAAKVFADLKDSCSLEQKSLLKNNNLSKKQIFFMKPEQASLKFVALK